MTGVAHGGVGGYVAICADHAKQFDMAVAECGEVGKGEGVVDSGVHVKDEFAGVHGTSFPNRIDESVGRRAGRGVSHTLRYTRPARPEGLFEEFVGGEIPGLRRVMHHCTVRICVGVLLGKEVEVLLRALHVVRAERERTILDLGGITPIVAVHDRLHAALDERRLQIRVGSLLDEDRGGVVRVRVRVFVTLLGGLHEFPYKSRIGGDGLVVGDDADGVRIAGHAVVGLGEAVEFRAVHAGLHAFPRGVEAAEIGFAAGKRLERGRADGHLVELAFAAVGLDHATDHGVGLAGAERGERLAVQILRSRDRGVGRQRAPDGARLLLHLHHLLDLRAFDGIDAHVRQIRQREIGLPVVHRLLGSGLCHGHDVDVEPCLLEIAFVLRHIHADMVGVGRPGKHEGDFGGAVGAGGIGGVCLTACGDGRGHGDGGKQREKPADCAVRALRADAAANAANVMNAANEHTDDSPESC